jgi:hypothetical protein
LACAIFLIACLHNGAEAEQHLVPENQPHYKGVPLFPAFEDYYSMAEDVCQFKRPNCSINVMMGDINDGIAFLQNGFPMVAIDRGLSSRIGYLGTQLIIAHEIGHLFCRHLDKRRSVETALKELEADKFAGFTSKQLKLGDSFFADTYLELGFDIPANGYPSFEERIGALAVGYGSNDLSEICPDGGFSE